VPANLTPALDSQTDLVELSSEGGYEAYVVPQHVTPSAAGAVRAPTANGLAIAGELVLWTVVAVLLVYWRPNRSRRSENRLIRRRRQNPRIVSIADKPSAPQDSGPEPPEELVASSGAGHG
jgi:hypothetical protein